MKGLMSIGVKEFKNKTLWIIYIIICLFFSKSKWNYKNSVLETRAIFTIH